RKGRAVLMEVLVGLSPPGKADGRDVAPFLPRVFLPGAWCLPTATAAVSSKESRSRAISPGRSPLSRPSVMNRMSARYAPSLPGRYEDLNDGGQLLEVAPRWRRA